MEKYLRPKQYYEDTYDRHTVEDCRRLEGQYNLIKNKTSKKTADKDAAAKYAVNSITHRLMLYFKKGERYVNRDKTIKELMDRDKESDELLENTSPLNGIYCNECGGNMFVESKMLHSKGLNEKDRVLFIFRCSLDKCGDGKGIFENGEELVIEPELCGKCGMELDKRYEKKPKKILTHYSCSGCGFKKVEELDLSVREKKKEIDKFFHRDKAKFCLSEEEGQKYREEMVRMEQFTGIMKDMEKREKNKKIYQKAANLKKLTVVELEKRLIPILRKHEYIKFELGKTEIGKDVFIGFTARDKKSGREEYDSKNNLKKIIQKSLQNTNWRLMSDGINYRLGLLSGRLRGYEREEDLIKIVKK